MKSQITTTIKNNLQPLIESKKQSIELFWFIGNEVQMQLSKIYTDKNPQKVFDEIRIMLQELLKKPLLIDELYSYIDLNNCFVELKDLNEIENKLSWENLKLILNIKDHILKTKFITECITNNYSTNQIIEKLSSYETTNPN